MKFLLAGLLSFLFMISANAAEIMTSDGGTVRLTSVDVGYSTFRPIQFCQKGKCELIPDVNTQLLQHFSEEDLNWESIFRQCENYKSLNQLVTWTEILSSIAVAAKPISVLRNLRSTKSLLASWGIWGRVAGNRIVFDTGVFIAGERIYSMPLELVENGAPYPELTPEDVALVSNLIEDVLNDSSEVYFLPEELIVGMATILKGCTSQLKQEYIYSNVESCMSGCHSGKEKPPRIITKKPPRHLLKVVPDFAPNFSDN